MKLLPVVLLIAALLYQPAQVDRPLGVPGVVERPTVNLPLSLRQENWGSGSCVHAAIVSLFRWQGRFNMATRWRQVYSGGEDPQGAAEKLDKEGVRYAYTTAGEVKFLEWALRTRRGCGVTVMGGAHFVTLVHLDSKVAILLDNNSIEKYQTVTREAFLAEWRSSNGWALTVLYAPAAPLPR